MKLKKKSAFWLTAFAMEFAILFAIGQMQYQKHGIGRPLWDVDIFYMFFCNLPFHLGKTLGVASHELSDNLGTLLASAFFFIVDLELYFEGEGFISNIKNFERICPVFETHVHPHLAKFGFILRYEKGKESITGYPYEPWHIRYVGVELAEKIKKSGLTLDEWIDR